MNDFSRASKYLKKNSYYLHQSVKFVNFISHISNIHNNNRIKNIYLIIINKI